MTTTSKFAAMVVLLSTVIVPLGSDAQVQRETPVTSRADAPLKWGPCPPIFPAGCEIAVLHGDPAKPNADVFLRVPGGYEIPAHSHTSAERMILVAGQLRVRYQGSPATTLTLGQYAYGPAKLPHHATCLSKESCTLFIAFEGPVDAETSSLD
jgi:quercetin dioxygenase-like cupin family protein